MRDTLAFYNTATTGGSTIVNNDYLQFFNGTSAGSSALTNNYNTSFFATSTAGSANIINTSVLGFYETSTAGSATITNGGVLEFVGSSTAGGATITNNSGSTTQFGQTGGTDTAAAGNATITNNSGSFTIFRASTTAGNAIITNNGGQTQFFDTSTAGNATITNIGAATLFIGNATAGNARLINDAGGTFDFSKSVGPNNNNELSAGSIEGEGQFNLGSNQLTVGSNNLSTTVSGNIHDGGLGGGMRASLVKVGTGTLTLTGTNPYTGRTLVNGGTLEVDGSIVSSNTVIVNAGGTLSGTGAVTRAAIEAGGTLAPGSAANPTGTLTSMTNLTFLSAAFYMVQVGASASNTNIVGTASVANATVQVAVTGGAQGDKSYDILHSSVGIGGTRFSGVQGLTPGFTETLSYSPTDVFLNLTANLGGGGQNINQQNVAADINNAFNNGGSLPAGTEDRRGVANLGKTGAIIPRQFR